MTEHLVCKCDIYFKELRKEGSQLIHEVAFEQEDSKYKCLPMGSTLALQTHNLEDADVEKLNYMI